MKHCKCHSFVKPRRKKESDYNGYKKYTNTSLFLKYKDFKVSMEITEIQKEVLIQSVPMFQIQS